MTEPWTCCWSDSDHQGQRRSDRDTGWGAQGQRGWDREGGGEMERGRDGAVNMKPQNHLILSVFLWSPWLLYMKEGLENLSACCRGYTWVTVTMETVLCSLWEQRHGGAADKPQHVWSVGNFLSADLRVSVQVRVQAAVTSCAHKFPRLFPITTVALKYQLQKILSSVWQHMSCKYTQHKCFRGTLKNDGLRCWVSNDSDIVNMRCKLLASPSGLPLICVPWVSLLVLWVFVFFMFPDVVCVKSVYMCFLQLWALSLWATVVIKHKRAVMLSSLRWNMLSWTSVSISAPHLSLIQTWLSNVNHMDKRLDIA